VAPARGAEAGAARTLHPARALVDQLLGKHARRRLRLLSSPASSAGDQPALVHAAWGGAPATAAWLLWRLDGHRYSAAAHAYDIYEHGGDWWLKDKLSTRPSSTPPRDGPAR
jgi:hypothetical protein